jgi:hypothetical protein
MKLSQLVSSASLSKWGYTAGGLQALLPIYKAAGPAGLTGRDQQMLEKAIAFLRDALNGEVVHKRTDAALPEDPVTSAQAFETAINVLLSSNIAIEDTAVSTTFQRYMNSLEAIRSGTNATKVGGDEVDELLRFFSKLSQLARARAAAPIFEHSMA